MIGAASGAGCGIVAVGALQAQSEIASNDEAMSMRDGSIGVSPWRLRGNTIAGKRGGKSPKNRTSVMTDGARVMETRPGVTKVAGPVVQGTAVTDEMGSLLLVERMFLDCGRGLPLLGSQHVPLVLKNYR